MSFEEQDRERHGRIESKQDEILRRWTAAEKRCDEEEAERVRAFEELEGRAMTRQERIDAGHDGLLRKMNVMTLEHLRILHDLRSDMQVARAEQQKDFAKAFDQGQAEARAGREALLQILDRLPPPQPPPPSPS